MNNKTNVNIKLIESFFQLVNTGNLDVKMNYMPRLLDQLEIFVWGKESNDKEFIQEVRRNLIHAFNEVSEFYIARPNEKAVRKITELFSQNAIPMDESWDNEKAVFGTKVALEMYLLSNARMRYKESVGQYGLFLNGQKDGYVNAVTLSDEAIYNMTKICMDNNLITTADTWKYPNVNKEE